MSKKGSKARKPKTKVKFAESSGLNQSGNCVESQIRVAAEQPMHPTEIQRILQLERTGPTPLNNRNTHATASTDHPSALHGPPQPFGNPVVQDPTSGAMPSYIYSAHFTSASGAASSPDIHLTSVEYGYPAGSMGPVVRPPQPFILIAQDPTSGAASTHIHDTCLTSMAHDYPAESPHSNFPVDFNYGPLAITQPRAGPPSLAGNRTVNMISRRSHVEDLHALEKWHQAKMLGESPGILAMSNSHLLYSLNRPLPPLQTNPRIMWPHHDALSHQQQSKRYIPAYG
ncbi:hypothetical protein HD554DRAFT_2035453 [Boletus coccyginus]|nr:hypothetical protein HD554DRAFT_2035453 [Boletus coccyginus]